MKYTFVHETKKNKISVDEILFNAIKISLDKSLKASPVNDLASRASDDYPTTENVLLKLIYPYYLFYLLNGGNSRGAESQLKEFIENRYPEMAKKLTAGDYMTVRAFFMDEARYYAQPGFNQAMDDVRQELKLNVGRGDMVDMMISLSNMENIYKLCEEFI